MFSWILALALGSAAPAPDAALIPRPQNHLPMAATLNERVPKRKDPQRVGVETGASSAALVDWGTGSLLFGKNSSSPQPIASITKLMTALVALDELADLKKPHAIAAADMRSGGTESIMPGDTVTQEDLFNLMLISSSNSAAVALSRATGLTPEQFVAKMNAKAAAVGMKNASFAEPSGLDPANRASAYDVAMLLREALSDDRIRRAVARREYRFTTSQGKPRAARSTDELLGSFLSQPPYAFLGGKTGYLDEAGYCFGAAAKNGQGNTAIAVVLGARTKEQRFSEVKKLLFWGFDAFEWPSTPLAQK